MQLFSGEPSPDDAPMLLPLLLASAALAIAALAVLLRRQTKHRPEASPPPQPKEAAPAAAPATPTEEADSSTPAFKHDMRFGISPEGAELLKDGVSTE